jgi:hypothetical protein
MQHLRLVRCPRVMKHLRVVHLLLLRGVHLLLLRMHLLHHHAVGGAW